MTWVGLIVLKDVWVKASSKPATCSLWQDKKDKKEKGKEEKKHKKDKTDKDKKQKKEKKEKDRFAWCQDSVPPVYQDSYTIEISKKDMHACRYHKRNTEGMIFSRPCEMHRAKQ